MSKVNLTFDTEIAKSLGIGAAIILQNIEFWQIKNEANKHNFFDGRYWVYNSNSAFEKLFDFMSKRQIRTSLEKLTKSEILVVGNYNKDKRDRTKWYSSQRIYSNCQKRYIAIAENDKCQLSEMTNASNQNDKPLPDNKHTVINPDINKEEEIKNFSDSNFSELKLFNELPDEKQKEKKVAPKKEKIGKEIIFPLVKKLAEYFPKSITSKLTTNDKKNWCETVEKLLRIDEYTEEEIIKAVKDARSHNFWKHNFLSLTKLRKKKDNITYMQKFLLLNGNEETANDGSGNFQEIQTDESMLT